MLKKSKIFWLKEFLMDEDAKVSQKWLIIWSIWVIWFAVEMLSSDAYWHHNTWHSNWSCNHSDNHSSGGIGTWHSDSHGNSYSHCDNHQNFAHQNSCSHTNNPTKIHTNECNHSSSCGWWHHSWVGSTEHSSYKKHCSNHNNAHNNWHNNNTTHSNQYWTRQCSHGSHGNGIPWKVWCHCNNQMTP